MKQQNNNYVEEMIERYIYQVTKHLTVNRKDIEKELQTLIYDMLEDRTHGSDVTNDDIDAVLLDLGNPSEMADKYRSIHQFLIGPELFPRYLFVLKIVLGATLLGICVVTLLDYITNTSSNWYQFFGDLVGNNFSGLLSSFASVTIIFAIFEWRGVKLKELTEPWKVSSLPPVPVKEASIPIGEAIIGIIFTTLVMILFIMAPQVLGMYFIRNGSTTAIPIFNLDQFPVVLPLFLTVMGLGVLKHLWELIERKYSLRYGIFTTVINTVSTMLLIIIFTKFQIWNPIFKDQMNTVFNVGASTASIAWDMITSKFILFLVFIYLLDTGITLYKSIKYDFILSRSSGIHQPENN